VPIFPFVEHRGMTFLAMTGEVDIEKRFQQVKDFDSKAILLFVSVNKKSFVCNIFY
jgi:hypothetical protein